MTRKRTAELSLQATYRLLEKLQTSEERYRLLIAAIGDVVFQSDAGGLTFLNPAWTDHFGFSVASSLSRPLADFIDPTQSERYQSWLIELEHHPDTSRSLDLIILDATSTAHWVEMRANYSSSSQTFTGVIRDITARKQSDLELDEYRADLKAVIKDRTQALSLATTQAHNATERLQAVLDAVPVGIFFSDDLDCTHITGNRAVIGQFEIEAEENVSASAIDPMAYGRQITYRCEGRNISDAELPLQRAIAENKVIAPMELEIILPSGKQWFAQASGAPILDSMGHVTGGVVVIEDVTESHLLKSRLDLENQRLALLHKLNAELVSQHDLRTLLDVVLDATMTLTQANFSLLQLVDETQKELHIVAHRNLPESCLDLIIKQSEASALYTELFQQNRQIVVKDHLEGSIYRNDPILTALADKQIQAVQSTPLAARNGKILGIISTYWTYPGDADDSTLRLLEILSRFAADLIELHQREEDLKREAIRKDEFLATLAHELRNPLAPIRNALEIMKMSGDPNPEFGRLREMMQRQLNHLIRLVDDLLDVSRITRGKVELRKERVTLASVFDHAIETCQPLLDTTSHTVNIELPTDNIMLEGDPVRLSQIFGNLLNNAAKYTKPGGTITVTAIVSADCVAVSIKDTGEGISVEMLPRVFDLFSQVDRTLQRSEGGLGIGLALVRGLVQLHGGKVEAMSKGIGQGSEFIVTLPLAQNTMEDHSIHENIASLTIAPRRILIVDDNHDAADSLGLILNSLGYSVKVVYAGTVALECLQAFDPHVVLLDIGMPVIDGLETARRIRHIPKFATTPLIALTGWGQDADRERTKAAGFTHHLVKPVDFNEVNALLKAMQTVE